MLVLCSDGLTSEAVLAALRPCTDGLGTAALVVTADPTYKEKNYHVPRCTDELTGLGMTVDLFDLDKTPCEALEAYDLVEFIGGNPYYLLDSIRRHGAEPVLRRLAEKKLLIGWSAAAFVFGPTLALADAYTPGMNTVGLSDLTACRLTEVEVLPHYDRFLPRFEGFEETCAAYEKKRGVKVLRLNDGDAVLIEGANNVIIRADRDKSQT